MDTSELKSAPLSGFPFDTKFVMRKDRYLNIPKPNLQNPIEESTSPSSEGSVLVSLHKTEDIDKSEERIQVKKSERRVKIIG